MHPFGTHTSTSTFNSLSFAGATACHAERHSHPTHLLHPKTTPWKFNKKGGSAGLANLARAPLGSQRELFACTSICLSRFHSPPDQGEKPPALCPLLALSSHRFCRPVRIGYRTSYQPRTTRTPSSRSRQLLSLGVSHLVNTNNGTKMFCG